MPLNRLIFPTPPHDSRPNPAGLRDVPLHGGIINQTVLRYVGDNAVPIIVVVGANADQIYARERQVRGTLDFAPTDVPLQRLLGLEGDQVSKEFLIGDPLHSILSNQQDFPLTQPESASLMFDLGRILSRMHTASLPQFGKITGNGITHPSENKSWEEYYLHLWAKRMENLRRVDPNKQVGIFTAAQVQQLLDPLNSFFVNAIVNGNVLSHVKNPRFTHHDFHFLNILAHRLGGGWYISGIIDLENATAGDPDIDLISIESQLWLANATYGARMKSHLPALMEGYRIFQPGHSKTLDNYERKRAVLHAQWALSYMEAIFTRTDFSKHPVTQQIQEYIAQHLLTLQSIALHGDLRDVNIPHIYLT